MLETIRKGDSGIKVLQVQYMLGGEQDGNFNDAFEKIVKEFQNKNSLTTDGIVGKNTYKTIVLKMPNVKNKSRGDAVKALQALLGIPIDGIFGPKTKASVIAFQTASDLTADAICGPNTWTALILGKDAIEEHKVGPKPIDYKQYDSRWGKKMYSNHGDKSQTMSSSACGPTSASDIVATWWNKEINPYDLAMMAVEWGNRTYNDGTSSTFFKNIHKKYAPNTTYMHAQTSMTTLINALDKGAIAVVNFGPGANKKWTKGG